MSSASLPIQYVTHWRGGTDVQTGEIVHEVLACLSVNGLQVAEMMCSPAKLDQLALGFLYNEGIISQLADVATLHVSASHCVEVWLNKPFDAPKRLIVTAGCGGGTTFTDPESQRAPLQSDLTVYAGQLAERMKELQWGAETYRQARGIHTAGLANAERLLLQVEDIGRHNCLDRLQGAALQAGIATQGLILLTSGRISSEMIQKAWRLGVPMVCSRTSPTQISVGLAQAWGICVVGYLRQDRMRVYTHPQRVLVGGYHELGERGA
jgi:FdhD protein